MPNLNPQILELILGVSSVLGLLTLLAYFYFLYISKDIDRSVKKIVEGEGLFNSDQVLNILKQFNNEELKLKALKEIAKLDSTKAEALLEKIKANIDVNHFNQSSINYYKHISWVAALVFILLAFLGLATKLISPETPTSSSPSEVKQRFDIKFLKPQKTQIGNNNRLEVNLKLFPLTEDNQDAATIFTGIITVYDEDKFNLKTDYSKTPCQENPVCIEIQHPIENILTLRGGSKEKHDSDTTMHAFFDLPLNIKRVRVYALFYQRETVNGHCEIDNSKPLPKNWDGLPYLAVFTKDGVKTTDLCTAAEDTQVIDVEKLPESNGSDSF